MNRISKFARRLTVSMMAITFASVLLAPASSFAMATAGTNTSSSPFCTNLTATINKVGTSLNTLGAKLTAAQNQQDQTLAANRQKEDAAIAANRQTWDTDRQTNFTKLEAAATTDAEKTAVVNYETAIISAVTTRRAAYDTARATYRSGVDSAVASRHTTVNGQVATFNDSVDSAEATAQAACTADSSVAGGPAIRTTFVTSLKTARQTFQADRSSDGKVKDDVATLGQTRNAAFKAADSVFDAATASARDTLKVAFGAQASSID